MFLAAATLREIGKQAIAGPTKADENMLLPLAQKMGKIIGRSSKQIPAELVEGFGNACEFEMARNVVGGPSDHNGTLDVPGTAQRDVTRVL